jgi:type IV pilus assembly protein PilA
MQKRIAGGFTLVEVALVMAIAGILAAIAMPAYTEYAVRDRVAELVQAAGRCKAAVDAFHSRHGRLPVSAAEAGCPERVTANANPLAVFNGEVIVQAVGTLASQLGPRNIFAFRAVCEGGCDGRPIRRWICAPSGSGGSSTTILPKYLPTQCRPGVSAG